MKKSFPAAAEGRLLSSVDLKLLHTMRRCHESGLEGVVSLEPQPFFRCHPSAPKSQWVMVVALWYRSSGWLEGLRLLRGKFKGKGAVGGRNPFPVADSPETTPPGPGSNRLWLRPKACIGGATRRKRHGF